MNKKYGYIPAPPEMTKLSFGGDKTVIYEGDYLVKQLEEMAKGKNNFKVIWINKDGNTYEAFFEWEE